MKHLSPLDRINLKPVIIHHKLKGESFNAFLLTTAQNSLGIYFVLTVDSPAAEWMASKHVKVDFI